MSEQKPGMPGSCREVWENARSALEAFEIIGRSFPDCECENFTVSRHSPCPMTGAELLIRILFSPIHFNKFTNRINLEAFVDVYKRGLSVNRRNFTTLEKIRRQALMMIERSQQSNTGVPKTGYALAVARCDDLTRLRFADGRRMCCVFDTAGKSNRSHADIVYSRFRRVGVARSTKKELVQEISALFSIVDAEDLF